MYHVDLTEKRREQSLYSCVSSLGHVVTAALNERAERKPPKTPSPIDMRGDRKRGRSSGGSWRLESVSGDAAETETQSSNETPRFLTGLFLGVFFVSPTMDLPSSEKCPDFVSP